MQRKLNQMATDQLILCNDIDCYLIKENHFTTQNTSSLHGKLNLWLFFQRVNNRQSHFYVAFKMSRKSFKENKSFSSYLNYFL